MHSPPDWEEKHCWDVSHQLHVDVRARAARSLTATAIANEPFAFSVLQTLALVLDAGKHSTHTARVSSGRPQHK